MSNIEIIRELYRAFEAEGLDRILELCDPRLCGDPGRRPAVGRAV